MKILCATDGIVAAKYPKEGIRNIVKGEYSEIMFNTSDIIMEGTSKLFLNTCRKENLKILAAYTNANEDNIELAVKSGCKFIILTEEEQGRDYYLNLINIAKENDLMILIENQFKDINGHYIRGFCSDAEEVVELIDSLNEQAGEECFGFALNVAVCNLCGQNMQDFILPLEDRLKMVILSDCDGNQESAMLPFTAVYNHSSRTDWLSLIRGLRGIDFDGLLVMQMEDTAAAFSPIIRSEVIKLSKTVAEYIAWQISIESLLKKYSSRVLFGAGNMCRAYMRCYGKEYPPLFTCDNNKKLWNTQFCDLTVNPPEKLKELPKDCAIFICNVYYSEIEEQIRDMGLENPIERFNDEYLPSYYFDRI